MPKFKYTQRFEDVSALLAYTDRPSPMGDGVLSEARGKPNYFGDAVSMQHMRKLTTEGWDAGRERVARLTAMLEDTIQGQIIPPEIAYDVTGDVLDIGRYVNGEPEDFMYFQEPEERRDSPVAKVVRLVMNLSISGSVHSDNLIERGAAMAACVSLLERQGIRCEVDVFAASSENLCTWIRIKEASMPIQIDALATMLAHPSTFRRLIFRAWELHPDIGREVWNYNGYGYPNACANEDKGDIYMDHILTANDPGHRETLAWIKEQLRAQGIKLEEN